jgi:hypothetical protein
MCCKLQLAHLHVLGCLKRECIRFINENSQVLMEPTLMALSTENPELWDEIKASFPSRKRKTREIAEV